MGALWTDNKDILVMLSDMDINAIAGTLKLYFRELPEPLLTDRLYPAFMEGIGKGSGMGKGSVPKRGSGWHCLLRDGRLPRVLPNLAHSVLAVLLARGAAPQGAGRALRGRVGRSCAGCREASGRGRSCCCTRRRQPLS